MTHERGCVYVDDVSEDECARGVSTMSWALQTAGGGYECFSSVHSE